MVYRAKTLTASWNAETSRKGNDKKMTPEQQQAVIAKACGWKGISPEYLTGYAPWRPTPYSERVMGDLESIPLDPLPDYLNDLNAMNDAEKVLTDNQRFDYGSALYRVVRTDIKDSKAAWWVLSATATQRAEAFLRTLNLWQE